MANKEQETGFDYRDMLVRFIGLVFHNEGSDYLSHNTSLLRTPVFTAPEMIELHKISAEGQRVSCSLHAQENATLSRRQFRVVK